MQNNIFLKSSSDETEKFTVTKDKEKLKKSVQEYLNLYQVSKDLTLNLLELIMPFTPIFHSYIASTPCKCQKTKIF